MPYQGLAEPMLKAGQWRQAVKLLDRGARQSVAEATYWTDLTELYLNCLRARGAQLDQIKPRALAALRKAAGLKPENPAVRQRMAEQFKALGELAQAEAIYTDLLEKFPSPVLRERLADVHLRNGKRDLAVAQLEQIKRELPTNPQVYFVLATLAAEEKLYPRAVELLDIALKLKPDFEQAWFELVSVRMAANQTGEALAVLDRVRSQTSKSFLTEFYAALVHSKAKDYPRAIERFVDAENLARAGETNRLTHLFYFQMGAAHERAGERTRAVELFRRALAMSPDFSEALNYLGYMWAERGENLAEARKLIERAVALEPKNAAFLDSLGWVLFKMGRPRPALKWLLESARLGEEPDATVHEHLGDVYVALKRIPEAREAYGKSLKIEVSEGVRKKFEALPAGPASGRKP
jgi:tetratricopeptide (TPR) repeat protein